MIIQIPTVYNIDHLKLMMDIALVKHEAGDQLGLDGAARNLTNCFVAGDLVEEKRRRMR